MELANVDDRQDAVPYSVIARGYDFIMSHVDYDFWATFIDGLLWHLYPNPHSILELGCGTGSFAMHLQPLGNYAYHGTDLCPEMIDVAREKVSEAGLSITFDIADFSNYKVEKPFDIVILLYDGLNYLTEKAQVASMLACTYEALKPGGIFFFDQSTPANSINNEEFFSDEGELDGFSYVRGSEYDRETRLHTTTFEIKTAGRTFFEEHVQRAYTLEDIQELILATGFDIEQAFDGFSSDIADDESERIHWIVRKPA